MFPYQWQSAIDQAKKKSDDNNFVSQIKDTLSGKGDFGFDLKAGEQVLQSKLAQIDLLNQQEQKTANSTPSMISQKLKTNNPYSGFAGNMALQAGIQPEEIEANKPVGRLATAGMLATAAFPSKGIGMISEGIPGARGLSSLLSKGKKLKPLAQEAAKYKSAEEFVRAQDGGIRSAKEITGEYGNYKYTIRKPSDDLFEVIDSHYGIGREAGAVKRELVNVDDLFTNDTLFDVSKGTNDRALKLAEKIKESGEVSPIIVDEKTMTVLEGKHRWIAMNELGEKQIPALVIKRSPTLAQEATKYKSAEDFVKAQPTYYRGIGGNDRGGNYFTTNKDFARDFTRSGQDSEIIQRNILPEDIYKAKQIPEAVNVEQVDNAILEAKKQGKKAILVDEGDAFGEQVYSVYVFDKSAIKTKSQLTDIWNKAGEITNAKLSL